MSCQYDKTRLDYATNYVRGDLSEAEQETFEAHYLECEECFSAVQFVEKTSVTMHHFGASIFAPAPARPAFAKPDWLAKLKAEWKDTYLAFSMRRKTAVPAFAVYVLLAVGLGFGYYWLNSSLKLAHQNTPLDRPSAMLPAGRTVGLEQLQPSLAWSISAATKANKALFDRLAAVQSLYQYHNYFLAAQGLAEIVKDFPEAIEAHLFLGISQLHINQPAEAIKSLRKVLELSPQHAAAQWYLAQGYLMQDDLAEAQSLLTTLVDQRDPQFSQRAASLLEKIDRTLHK